MSDDLQQKTTEIKEIYYGGLLYFTLFAAVIYLLNKNWIYAICFAFLLTGCLGSLCRNNLRNFSGYVITIPLALLWIGFNHLLSSKIITALQNSISSTQSLKGANRFFSYCIADNMPIVNAVVFCIGFVILTIIVRQLISQLPESWKLPERFHVIIVFCVNFLRLLLISAVLAEVASYGFKQIQFSASWLIWIILLLPWLFCCKTWKDAVKSVKESNSESSEKQANETVKAIQIPDITLPEVPFYIYPDRR